MLTLFPSIFADTNDVIHVKVKSKEGVLSFAHFQTMCLDHELS